MDEEISIIDNKTRNEKIKIFFVENKKKLITLFLTVILLLVGYYSYLIYLDNKREYISDLYNSAVIEYQNGIKSTTTISMKEVIKYKDKTYSPLALYFLIDNNLIESIEEINNLFDNLIEMSSLDKEIKNLIIYKKALFNADHTNESELLDIVNPLIKSDSLWKSHALYLVAEFFYSNGEKEKSKEFFNQILNTKDANQEITLEAKRRLSRDLSE